MAKDILKSRKFSQKHILKGESFLKKEHKNRHDALFLPITIVASCFYYGAHTDANIEYLITLSGAICAPYYLIARVLFNYGILRHLTKTIPNYTFRWHELLVINWANPLLLDTWEHKLRLMANLNNLSEQNISQIIQRHKPRTPLVLSYLFLVLVISLSITFGMLLTVLKPHPKNTDFSRYRRRSIPVSIYNPKQNHTSLHSTNSIHYFQNPKRK